MQNNNPHCDPVEIVDKKTGLKKLVYLCTAPIKRKAAFYKENQLHFWTDITLMATVAILLFIVVGLWIFNSRKITSLVDFSINYNESEMVNGQRVNFEIVYKNTTKKTFNDASVLIKYPDGLLDEQISDTRYNQETNVLQIGTLGPKEEGKVNLSGLLLSDIGVEEKFIFALTYINDLGQPQQELNVKTFTVNKSVAPLALEVPQRVIIGSEFPSKFSFVNNAGYTLTDLTLSLRYPNGFANNEGNNVTLDNLSEGQITEKIVNGLLQGIVPGDYLLEAVLVTKYQDRQFVLSKVQKNIKAEYSKVITSFVKTEVNKAIKPGEQSVATLRIENNENFTIYPKELKVFVNGDYADLNFLANHFQGKFSDRVINLATALPEKIEPGQSTEIQITVAALQNIFINNNNQGPQDLKIETRLTFNAQSGENVYISSVPLVIPVNSKITAISSGVFFTKGGDQVGVGSIPPVVGEYTAYWGVVTLRNGANSLRNVYVRAQLGDGVEFTEQYNVTDGAPIRYIAKTNEIEWYLPELEAHAGVIGASPEGRVLLAIVPSESQVGTSPTLLKNITVSGIDSRTSETITTTASSISTAIFKDPNKDKVSF